MFWHLNVHTIKGIQNSSGVTHLLATCAVNHVKSLFWHLKIEFLKALSKLQFYSCTSQQPFPSFRINYFLYLENVWPQPVIYIFHRNNFEMGEKHSCLFSKNTSGHRIDRKTINKNEEQLHSCCLQFPVKHDEFLKIR